MLRSAYRPVYVSCHAKVSDFGNSVWSRAGEQAVSSSNVSVKHKGSITSCTTMVYSTEGPREEFSYQMRAGPVLWVWRRRKIMDLLQCFSPIIHFSAFCKIQNETTINSWAKTRVLIKPIQVSFNCFCCRRSGISLSPVSSTKFNEPIRYTKLPESHTHTR